MDPTTPDQAPVAPAATCGCDCQVCTTGQHDQCPTGKCTMKDQQPTPPPAETA